MSANAEEAVEAILGKFDNAKIRRISLQHVRGTQGSVTLTTDPRSLTYTFHPTTGEERLLFNSVCYGSSMWVIRRANAGRLARKPSIEELAHSIVVEHTPEAIELDAVEAAKLTIKQLAKFVVLGLAEGTSPEQALREAKQSAAR